MLFDFLGYPLWKVSSHTDLNVSQRMCRQQHTLMQDLSG